MEATRVLDEDHVEDVNGTSEIFELNQGKKRLKQSESGRKTVKVVTKKKVSLKSDGDKGKVVEYIELLTFSVKKHDPIIHFNTIFLNLKFWFKCCSVN